jgi:hypothetical protein
MKIALRAANGRYVKAEGGGDNVGIVRADGEAIGPWEIWAVHRLPGGHIALQSSEGRFLSAEGGGGGEVHANRVLADAPGDVPVDLRTAIGPWEHWAVVGPLRDGAPVSLRSFDGHFLVAEVGSADPILGADRTAVGPWEVFTLAVVEADRPDIDVPGAVGLTRRFGARAIGDDTGAKLYVGLSRFSWLRDWRFDSDRVLLQMDEDRAAGYRYARCLAQVEDIGSSTFWAGRQIDHRWPDHAGLVASMTRAAAERGLLILWTLIGKPMARADRGPYVARCAEALSGVASGVLLVEVMNEPAVGGQVSAAELVDLHGIVRDRAPQLLAATGAVWTEQGWNDDNEYRNVVGGTAFSPGGWQRTQRDIGVCHLDRNMSVSELQDRPWRQGWDVGLLGTAWIDNEAVGPGSSVTNENRPEVLRSHRAVNMATCRAFASCLHGRPGVRGDDPWIDVPAYKAAPKAVRFLDGLLPNGRSHNANNRFPGRPFTLASEFLRAETNNRRGVVRAYTGEHPDGRFFTIPFGAVSDFELRVERALAVQCFQQDVGDLLWERQVAPGDVLTFTAEHVDYLLISRPL